MKTLRWFIFVIINTICLLSTTNVSADNRASAFIFTAGGGYDYFSSKRNIKNTSIPYAALGYDISRHWGIEGLLGIFNTTSNVPEEMGKMVNGTLFLFDVLYHFNAHHQWEPMILGGVGITSLNPNGTDAHTEGNINAGLGAQYFFDQVVAIRLEARDLYTIVNAKNDIFLDAGVSFYLDLC